MEHIIMLNEVKHVAARHYDSAALTMTMHRLRNP